MGYVKSRSDLQLRNRGYENQTSDCMPKVDVNGMAIVPCGFVAWSLFNDTYSFSTDSNQQLQVNKRHISWKSDKEDKFGSDVFPKNFQNGSLIGGGRLNESLPLNEQEDLIVWMRTAALPTFRKLYNPISS
ncbi:ALA-interacting subunit 3-like [Cynara cardunculus var. scolymus]|uniref:ALA-interacting subunit 3-like n=1 Tax=Cynara cardunculus var. scolymus TaxID=59895 RepID=UPI000D625AE5|nr:ALA-interacting subunit 3-like [Cynara cardunculus var. scolymus]